ncbi:MAG TPA: hypothetical protein VHY37_02135 [Tepidisphaeraceae bacterium]|nr:hypothetical protein [Tepidisphaeraceae bacterium]
MAISFFTLCLPSVAVADAPATQPAADAQKVEVAIFPLAGTAGDDARDKVGFALRMKLDRTGVYDAIDGPTMQDMADGQTIDAATPAKTVEDLASDSKPSVIMWGQLDAAGDTTKLKLNLLDLREPNAKPVEIDKHWNDPTQIRFRLEELLATLPDVEFEHPVESSITNDAAARALWATNPNLVVNGTFATSGHWDGIYESEKYPVEISDHMPAEDKVSILKGGGGAGPDKRNVLAMNLSLNAAQNNGLACLSDAIKIEPNTRYRIQYRYKSDGPTLHVFVKGYTLFPDAATGKPTMRECYRRQVPPSGPTDGKWVTVIDDMNPQSPQGFPVQELRVDLYAYLNAGTVEFDDVQLKAVGSQTHHPHDAAMHPNPKP